MPPLTKERRALDLAILVLYRSWARDVAPDDLDCTTVQRLCFARWLVQAGRLNEGS